jgi:hypothetical protein
MTSPAAAQGLNTFVSPGAILAFAGRGQGAKAGI